jgi:hypothetical protein
LEINHKPSRESFSTSSSADTEMRHYENSERYRKLYITITINNTRHEILFTDSLCRKTKCFRRRQHEMEMHGPTAIRNTTLYSLSTENETPAEL